MIEIIKIKLNCHDFYIINENTILQLKKEAINNKALQLLATYSGYKYIGVEALTKTFYESFEDWEVIRDKKLSILAIISDCKDFLEDVYKIQIKEIDVNSNKLTYNGNWLHFEQDGFNQCLLCGEYTYNYYNKNESINKHHCNNESIHSLKETYENCLNLKKIKSKFSNDGFLEPLLFEEPLPITFPDFYEYLTIKKDLENEKDLDIGYSLNQAKRANKEFIKIKEERDKLNFIENFYDLNFEKLEIRNENNNIKLYIETEDKYLIDVINSYKIESPIEQILYQKIYRIGLFKIIPQYNIDYYIVDFLIRDDEDKDILVIECDGFEYHNKFYMQRDYERQRYLQLKGYLFMRFTGSEIYNNVDECAREIILYYQLLKNKLK